MRVVFLWILPIVFPLLILIGWMAYHRLRARNSARPMPTLGQAPWLWMAAVTLLTVAAGVILIDSRSGEPPGGTYVPPQIKDGQIIPGHIER